LTERRLGGDRRQSPSFPPVFSPNRRRKSKGRRPEDQAGYVDIYGTGCWTVALAVLGLSLFDALVTWIQLLAGRIKEANPLMAAALNAGGFSFFVSLKVLMTALPLAIIILHKEWALGKFAARVALFAYLLIALYHVYLILGWPPA